MFTARGTTEGTLTLRGGAAFVAEFLTPCSKPKALQEQGPLRTRPLRTRPFKESDGLVLMATNVPSPFGGLVEALGSERIQR